MARCQEEAGEEEADLDLEYGDCDPSFAQELSELYAYSELPDFPANAAAFKHYHKGSLLVTFK